MKIKHISKRIIVAVPVYERLTGWLFTCKTVLVFIASGKNFNRLNVKKAESDALRTLATKKCFILTLHTFKYGET